MGLTSHWVTGVTVAIAVAAFTGAEKAQFRVGSPVAQSALLAVLPHVALGAGALLYPAGRGARTKAGARQGNVIQVAGTCWKKSYQIEIFFKKKERKKRARGKDSHCGLDSVTCFPPRSLE